MLTVRIIPCLDTADGRVVKGVRFANLRDAGDPAECASRYEDQGADEIVLLDVAATPDERSHRLDTVRAVRAVLSIPLAVGGGVRSVEDASALLDAGADKVAVNTAAWRDPTLLERLALRYGSQCIVLAIDAACVPDGSWQVVIESGRRSTGSSAVTWASSAADRGAGELLLTSVDRDGTRSGYDLALISAVSRAVRVPVIASGGARTPDHLCDAIHAGADAVLAASIFHDGEWSVANLKLELAQRHVRVRL